MRGRCGALWRPLSPFTKSPSPELPRPGRPLPQKLRRRSGLASGVAGGNGGSRGCTSEPRVPAARSPAEGKGTPSLPAPGMTPRLSPLGPVSRPTATFRTQLWPCLCRPSSWPRAAPETGRRQSSTSPDCGHLPGRDPCAQMPTPSGSPRPPFLPLDGFLPVCPPSS